jgi:NodT family efflux transporter outer membrane factor (OMF) lipoprotein
MPLSTKSLRRLAVTASALALSACATVGPNFKAPAAPTGAAASGYAMRGDAPAPGVSLTPEARVAGPWWQAFGSPELDATVREALANNPTTAEARANLEKAQAQLAATRGAQLPQVDANAGVQRERINLAAFGFTSFPGLPPFANPTINLYSIGGAVSYDLDLFGKLKRATEADKARVDRSAREADAAYLSLSGNVVLQAMRIASLRAQLATVQEIIADDQRVIDMVRQAHAAGGQPRSAIVGGVSQLAQDQALAPPLQRELDAARHQMALLVGKSPAEWTAPDFDMATLAAMNNVPVSLPSELVRRRPDILAAEAELHAATAEIGVAVANQYPDIRLSAALTQSALHPGDIFQYAFSGWDVLGGVTAPLFHGGTLKAERKVAEAEARASLSRYQATVTRAFVQVSDVLADLGSDQASIESLTRAVSAAEATSQDAQTALKLGGGTLSDVVQAHRALSRARRALVEMQGQRYADLVELYTATAADWRTAT